MLSLFLKWSAIIRKENPQHETENTTTKYKNKNKKIFIMDATSVVIVHGENGESNMSCP